MRTHFLFLQFFSVLFSVVVAQEIMVSGAVLDSEDNSPLYGVNITAGNLGTSSDENGRFNFSVPVDAAITFSYIGYESITVKAQPELTIHLHRTVLRSAEILVNATRAVSGVTPVSFSNLTAAEIKTRFTVEDVPMVLASEPGVWAYSESGNGTGYSYISIRGFDQSRIAVLLDNVPLNDNESHQVYWVDHGDILSDAQDVQIQRGIGNSLYGSSAFGGSINVTTLIASDQHEVGFSAGSGSFNTSKYQMHYRSGNDLGRNTSLSIRASQIESDGYRADHRSLQRGLFFGLDHRSARITNQFRGLIGYENTQLIWDGISMDDINNRKKRRAGYQAYTDNFLQQIYSLNSLISFNPDLYFRNTGYLVIGKGYYEVYKQNRDYYSYNLDVNDQYTDEQEMALFTDLLRRKWIANNYWGIIPALTWRRKNLRLDIGSEMRFYLGNHFGEVTDFSKASLVGVLGSDWYRYYQYQGKKNTFSGFIHLVWTPNEKVTLMADLQRQFHNWRLKQKKLGHALGHQLSANWDFLNPRLGMIYHLSEQFYWFVNYGKAQKEPADNQIITADDVWSQPVMAAAEVIHDWEMGFRISLGKGGGNLNYYRINYRNEQLKNIDVAQEGEYEYYSADSTTHQGVEWEIEYQLNPRLNVTANGSILLNTFNDGNLLPNIPTSLMNWSLDYQPSTNWHFFAYLKSVGEMYVDRENRDEGRINPYFLLDIGGSFSYWNFKLLVKVNNAFDKLYSTYGYSYESDGYNAVYWPGATRNGFISLSYTFK
ncbi:MAG: TonB-dependent receptor [Fidelibacterota bacterium]